MDSRWDQSKKESNWHFDDVFKKNKQYTEVCTFVGSWSELSEHYTALTEDSKWTKKRSKNGGPAEQGAVNDLINAGANPDITLFSRVEVDKDCIFYKASIELGLEDAHVFFQTQHSGSMIHMHVDRHGTIGREDTGAIPLRRFLVMLEDWTPGHTVLLGNQYWIWHKGQCITWDKNVPHGTANFSYSSRPMLQITGYETEKTRQLLTNSGYQNFISI